MIPDYQLRFLSKIVQTPDARHCRRQSRGNLWVTGIGPVVFAVDEILMDLRVQRRLHLRLYSGELDHRPAMRDPIYLEAVVLQPSGHQLQVLARGPELNAKFIRREPLVVIRRGLVLLVVEKFMQREILLGLRFSTSSMRSMGKSGGAMPTSNCGRDSGCVLPRTGVS